MALTPPRPWTHLSPQVHYRGSLPNGNVFDDSFKRGEPAEFKLKHTIPGFAEGLSHVKVQPPAPARPRDPCPWGTRPLGRPAPPHCAASSHAVRAARRSVVRRPSSSRTSSHMATARRRT